MRSSCPNPFPRFPLNPLPPESFSFAIKKSCSILTWPNYTALKHDLSFRRLDVIPIGFLPILYFKSVNNPDLKVGAFP